MSGTRQHTIPRFLLKNFGSRTQGEEVFVWMYRKGGSGAEVNTKKVAVEKSFYGHDGPLSVDGEITALEPEFSTLLDVLKTHAQGSITDRGIPSLIAHLCIRTRFLRQCLVDSVYSMTDELCDHLTDPGTVRELVLNRILDRDRLARELIARGVSPLRVDDTIASLKPHLAEYCESMMPSLIKSVQTTVQAARSMLPVAARDAHIGALAKDPAGSKRADSYANLNWFAVNSSVPLLIGDTVCLFETSGKRRFKPLDDQGDDVQRVFLPVSARRLLLGTPYSTCPDVDFTVLNKAIARCSYEFFVSSVALSPDSPLPQSIGQWSGLLSEQELAAIVSEAKAGFPSVADAKLDELFPKR